MRIALRTSGGRGEYELAGRQGNVYNRDLFGLALKYEISPELIIPSHSTADMHNGKPRLRLEDPANAKHAAPIFAATLLLPQPVRELRKTGTSRTVLDQAYSITDIDVDVVERSQRTATLRPTALWIRNSAGVIQKIDVAERMAIVSSLWDETEGLDSELAELLRSHREAVLGHPYDHRAIIRAAQAIQDYIETGGDALPRVRKELDEGAGVPVVERSVDTGVTEAEPPGGEEDDTDVLESSRTQVAKWRLQRTRGAAERRFSQQVKEAYDFRCVLSGERLPPPYAKTSPGVDAAHIAPWAVHGINTVGNGLCLNKLCHWAFDAGLLRIDFDSGSKFYTMTIPPVVKASAKQKGLDLRYFTRLEGPIPPERLPENPKRWPSPKHLADLNKEVFGG